MDSNSMFDAVKAFVKKAFGKDVANEEEATKALQEGAENPNLSLDAIKTEMQATMKAETDLAIKTATDAVLAKCEAMVSNLTGQVVEMVKTITDQAQPDQIEETEAISELQVKMDSLATEMAALKAKKSGTPAKMDAPPVKGKEEKQADFEKREEHSIMEIVNSRKNGQLKVG